MKRQILDWFWTRRYGVAKVASLEVEVSATLEELGGVRFLSKYSINNLKIVEE